MLNKSIGDYVLTISNEKYLAPNGKNYEVTGIEPDIHLEVFTKENMFKSHRDAIWKIVDIINATRWLTTSTGVLQAEWEICW